MMKKAIFTFFCFSGLFCFASQAWAQDLQVIPVDQLTENELDTLMEGSRPNVAVEFPAHTIIPVGFFLKGDLVQLTDGDVECGQVEFMRTVYARSAGENLLFSIDLQDWKPLLLFITGKASIALSIKNNLPHLLFGAEINRRE